MVSHILTVLSSDPDAIMLPSLDRATQFTALRWPIIPRTSFPVDISQMITRLSSDPETKCSESLENTNEVTGPSCAARQYNACAVSTDQTWIAWSREPDASKALFVENSRHVIGSEWQPSCFRCSRPTFGSQTVTVPPSKAATKKAPDGEKRTKSDVDK